MGGAPPRTPARSRWARWLVCALLVTVSSEAGAHPVPRDNHDRAIAVRLTPGAVVVHYVLDLDEGRAARDVPRGELVGVATPGEFYAAFTGYFAPVLAGNLAARLDGKPLGFACTRQEFHPPD